MYARVIGTKSITSALPTRMEKPMTAILGIDVAKNKFDVALYRNGKYKTRSFENKPQGFEALEKA